MGLFILCDLSGKKKNIKLRNNNGNKSIVADLEIKLISFGDFSEYLEDGVLNKEKITKDIFNGKLPIQGISE